MLQSDVVFSSQFPHPEAAVAATGESFFTFVNRVDRNSTGPQITLNASLSRPPLRYFDMYHGVELYPTIDRDTLSGDASVTLNFDIEALGFGAIFVTGRPLGPEFVAFLQSMKKMSARALASYDNNWNYLPQTLVQQEIEEAARPSDSPPGMVAVPGGMYQFESSGVEIEGGTGPSSIGGSKGRRDAQPTQQGVDVQYPWEPSPRRAHSHALQIDPFYIDKYPVTCAQFSQFLVEKNYTPRDSTNFLKNWDPRGSNHSVPIGWTKKPVTHVSVADAKAYCAAYDKRLPHSWEWQYAARGDLRNTSKIYPWGATDDERRRPKIQTGYKVPPPSDVDEFAPAGDSAFGMSDIVGNVWQMTDVFEDAHTRSVQLRGGSHYRPSGSRWYFPEALPLNQHEKYLLMDDSYERAATLGFRCAVKKKTKH